VGTLENEFDFLVDLVGRLLLLSVQEMKKYSMLAAGIMIILVNISGLFLAVYYKPLTLIMLVVSFLIIIIVLWIEIRKKDILLESYLRESYFLFGSCVVMQVYFAITAFALLVYLNQANVLEMNTDSKL
jgi:hypothetical protein